MTRRAGNTMRDPDALARDAFSGGYDPRRPIEEQLRQMWRALVKARNGYSFHTFDSRRSDTGWPDESSLVGGQMLFLEFKAPGRKPTPKQREVLRLLNEAGQRAYLVTSSGDPVTDALALRELL